MSRKELIAEYGEFWPIWTVSYADDRAKLPCVDCGCVTITRELRDPREAVCTYCACWRLGGAVGKWEALAELSAGAREGSDGSRE